jgi:hypothetical protein
MGTTSKIFCVDMFFPQIQVALTRPYILGYSLRDPQLTRPHLVSRRQPAWLLDLILEGVRFWSQTLLRSILYTMRLFTLVHWAPWRAALKGSKSIRDAVTMKNSSMESCSSWLQVKGNSRALERLWDNIWFGSCSDYLRDDVRHLRTRRYNITNTNCGTGP